MPPVPQWGLLPHTGGVAGGTPSLVPAGRPPRWRMARSTTSSSSSPTASSPTCCRPRKPSSPW